jgi:hypothetical protein
MDETSLLREALKQQSIKEGGDWLKKVEKELKRPLEDIWRRAEENNNNV